MRHTSLDEFPQFWNVLIGDMSLVGTRPPTPDEVTQYEPHGKDCELNQALQAFGKLMVVPPLTTLKLSFLLDIDYQRKWSVISDLSLLVKTVWVVLKKSGAY